MPDLLVIVAVAVVLFVSTNVDEIFVLVAFFADPVSAAWCFMAHALVSHPRAGPTVRKIAEPLTPVVLMAIGVLIIIESGAYRLVL